MKISFKITAIVFLVLILDQALKIWVKTNMTYGEEIHMLGEGINWAKIHFVENNGMAFGLSLGGEYGKLALSLFRILAVGFLAYYIGVLIKKKANFGLLLSFGLILAGAVGNILDSAFYGLLFSASGYHTVAELLPEGGGYSSFLHGKVVDMLYFPIAQGIFPDWVPIWSGKPYLFFKPVFNLADMSITIGVLNILIFQRQFFSGVTGHQQEENTESIPVPTEETTAATESPITNEAEDNSGSFSENGAGSDSQTEATSEEPVVRNQDE